MVTINIEYQGNLRCEAVHGPSGTVLHTTPPKDNMGNGDSFSPTDLMATALGSCMATVMGIAARPLHVDLKGTRIEVQKEMAPAPTRKISALRVKIHVPIKVTEEQRQKLEEAALHCPVHKSIHPDVQMPIEFTWG